MPIADVAQVADPPDEGDDVDLRYYEHLLSRGEVVVAEVSDVVIGYAGALPVGGLRHITDLFLHPDARGHGIGSRLLDALPLGVEPTLTFSSQHPAALPLYARRGLVPRWPLLYLRGTAASLPAPRLEVVAVSAEVASALESSWLGWQRTAEYQYWSQAPGGRIVSVLEAGEPVAVGCVGRRRHRDTLLHLSSIDRAVTQDAVLSVLATCGDDVLVAVPGENPTLVPLLEAGWRVLDHDILCATDSSLIDARTLIPHPGLL
jgi:GNAT superfamily N-acetyltransferase